MNNDGTPLRIHLADPNFYENAESVARAQKYMEFRFPNDLTVRLEKTIQNWEVDLRLSANGRVVYSDLTYIVDDVASFWEQLNRIAFEFETTSRDEAMDEITTQVVENATDEE